MSAPYIGEIRMFAGNFAPRSWAYCHGQLQNISQNNALFSLLGTSYGGDGRTTFALPDLRGRTPIHSGTGPGLSPRSIGQKTGTEDVTLQPSELPAHNHGGVVAVGEAANSSSPDGNTLGNAAAPVYVPGGAVPMSPATGSPAGGSRQHPNMMPFQTVNFIIALYGVYPSRQ